jgi:hypothetical protein
MVRQFVADMKFPFPGTRLSNSRDDQRRIRLNSVNASRFKVQYYEQRAETKDYVLIYRVPLTGLSRSTWKRGNFKGDCPSTTRAVLIIETISASTLRSCYPWTWSNFYRTIRYRGSCKALDVPPCIGITMVNPLILHLDDLIYRSKESCWKLCISVTW